MFKILIIEDDVKIRTELAELLHRNHYEVHVIDDFVDVKDQILKYTPDLILLDVNIPNEDGYKLCTQIRGFSKIPIIFVTSRDTELDELMAISIGGDDFITKPYNTSILLARIFSLLKRVYPDTNNKDILECKGTKLHILTSTIEYENQKTELTKTELKILYYLFVNKNKIVPRADIIEYLWDSELFVDDNALSVNITRIRKKLERMGLKEFLVTKRGQGYLL